MAHCQTIDPALSPWVYQRQLKALLSHIEMQFVLRRSNPLAANTRFFDVKLPAKLEEDLVVNDCLSEQTRQFLTLDCQQFPCQPLHRLIFVE
jgi:hypothetical protein